jgi:hypothetical protein
MISVDIEEIERLADVVTMISTKSDETLEKLRRISNEMLNDIELLTYPQGTTASEIASLSLNTFSQANDTIQALRNVLFSLAEIYKGNEKDYSNAIARMTAVMDSLSVSMTASVVSADIPNIEVSDVMQNQSDIQRLVDESSLEMQLTNISAVSKVIREDYDINDVRPLEES